MRDPLHNYIYDITYSVDSRERTDFVVINNKDCFSSQQVVSSAQWLYLNAKISGKEWQSVLDYYDIKKE